MRDTVPEEDKFKVIGLLTEMLGADTSDIVNEIVRDTVLPDASRADTTAVLVPKSEQVNLDDVREPQFTVIRGLGSQVSVTVAIFDHCNKDVEPEEFRLKFAFKLVMFGADLSGEH